MAEQLGSRKIFLGNSQTFLNTKEKNNMTLTFDYIGGQWLFSLNNVTQNVRQLIDKGYTVRLQMIRVFTGKVRSHLRKTNPADDINRNTKEKKTSVFREIYPGSVDITSKVLSNISSINATDFITSIIYYDQYKMSGRGGGASDNLYSSEGYWFRQYKFCVRINNVDYAVSTPLVIYTHYNGAIPESEIDSGYVLDANELHIYSL